MSNKEASSDLVYCTYVLNGEPLSRLVCDGVSYDAFSGDAASYVNEVRYQDIPKSGPIPLGKYYILDRESGGHLGWARQPLSDLAAGTDRGEWLSLYRDDDVVNDETFINGTRRGEFRIHPVGPKGISQGCITLFSLLGFNVLRQHIRNRPGQTLPGKSVKYYGLLEVIEEISTTTQ